MVWSGAERLQKLITQMKWRLKEGQGEAVYEVRVRLACTGTRGGLLTRDVGVWALPRQLGYEDNGFPKGLPRDMLQQSVDTLCG